jgi:hypothetical protein
MNFKLYRLINSHLNIKAVVSANDTQQARAMMTEMTKDERGHWIPQTKREKDSWRVNSQVECFLLGATTCPVGVILKEEGSL